MKVNAEDLTLTLVFEEDLISTTVKQLLPQCRQAMQEDGAVQTVIADVTKVEMIDSQGLNFLLGLYQDAGKHQAAFRVVGASPANARLFEFVNLKDRFGLR